MSDHVSAERLEDYAAGTLTGEAIAVVERHLSDCEACRVEADASRALLADLAAMRRELAPPRDLRPDIWRAIDSTTAESDTDRALEWRPRLGQRTLARTRGWLAAAAVLLVAVTSVLTWQVASRRSRLPAAAALPVASEYVTVAARYVTATDELEHFLEERRADLSPETVRILEESLRVIDHALAEARAAIREDPGNADLSRLLLATYEKKLGLLRNAAQGQAGI